MEAVFKKRPLFGAAQEKTKDKPPQQNTAKGPDEKHWLEQLAGTIPDDKKDQDKWYKLLMHPLVMIGGIITLVYWSIELT